MHECVFSSVLYGLHLNLIQVSPHKYCIHETWPQCSDLTEMNISKQYFSRKSNEEVECSDSDLYTFPFLRTKLCQNIFWYVNMMSIKQ